MNIDKEKQNIIKKKPYGKTRAAILAVGAAVILFLTAAYLLLFQHTCDAIIDGDLIYISSEISGQIIELNSPDNYPVRVKKGEIIARIDSEEYENKLKTAKAELEKANNELKNTVKNIDKTNAIVLNNKTDMENAALKLEYANSDYIRYKNAYQDGSVTKSDLENAEKNLEIAKNIYNSAQDALKTALKDFKSTVSKKNLQNSKIKELTSQLQKAELDLSYTTITAPLDGIIVNKNVKSGDYIQTGQPILTVMSDKLHVRANFKENQIKYIKPDKIAVIKINKPGKKIFRGKTDFYLKALKTNAERTAKEAAVDKSETNNKAARTIPIKINFSDDISNHSLMPDMKASVWIYIK